MECRRRTVGFRGRTSRLPLWRQTRFAPHIPHRRPEDLQAVNERRESPAPPDGSRAAAIISAGSAGTAPFSKGEVHPTRAVIKDISNTAANVKTDFRDMRDSSFRCWFQATPEKKESVNSEAQLLSTEPIVMDASTHVSGRPPRDRYDLIAQRQQTRLPAHAPGRRHQF